MLTKKKLGLLSVTLSVVLISLMFFSNFVFADSIEEITLPTIIEMTEVPPDNFDPLTASPEELEEYGFPQKPIIDTAQVALDKFNDLINSSENPKNNDFLEKTTYEVELKNWESIMENCKEYVKPEQVASYSVHGGTTSTMYSKNWAGYLIKDSSNIYNGYPPKYTEVSASWIQPAYNGSSIPSFWVGFDGATTSTVLQAGADSNATAAGGTSKYQFWVQNYPLGSVWQKTPVINGGDTLYTKITYGGSTSKAFLSNQTTGKYTIVSFETPHYTGSSAEFIHEAVGGTYDNWGTTKFSNCSLKWKTASGAEGSGHASAYNNSKIIMTTNGLNTGTIKASTSDILNGDFTVTSK